MRRTCSSRCSSELAPEPRTEAPGEEDYPSYDDVDGYLPSNLVTLSFLLTIWKACLEPLLPLINAACDIFLDFFCLIPLLTNLGLSECFIVAVSLDVFLLDPHFCYVGDINRLSPACYDLIMSYICNLNLIIHLRSPRILTRGALIQ